MNVTSRTRYSGGTAIAALIVIAATHFSAANAATVTTITSAKANAAYGIGTVIDISLTYNAPVIVTGLPTLALNANNGSGVTYISSNANVNGTTTLLFHYTVASGDTSNAAHLDCLNPMTLGNGVTIKDGSNADASLVLPTGATTAGALAKTKSIVVDGVRATVSQVSSTMPAGTYHVGDLIPVTVVFTKNVYVSSGPSIALNIAAGVTSNINYTTGTGTKTFTFNYTVGVGDTSADLDCASTGALTLNGATIKDLIGNDAVLTLPALGTANSLGAKNLVINSTPSAFTVTPSSGPTVGGNTVIISGVNFSGTTSVKFGGSSGTLATSTTLINSTQINTVPAGASAGTVDLYVLTSNGNYGFTIPNGYSFVSAPTLTTVVANQGPYAGGQVPAITGNQNYVTLTGTGFEDANSNSTVTGVFFGGTAATSITVTSATTLTCVPPAATVSTSNTTVDVAVSSTGGSATKTNAYTYVALPTITSVAANFGNTNGGDTIMITGTNLLGTQIVTFGTATVTSNVNAPIVVNGAGTQVTCTTPAHPAGVVNLSVTTPGGVGTKTSAFTFQIGPKITKVNLSTGTTAGGTPIVITGSSFTGATVTFVDNVSNQVLTPTSVVVAANQITCVSPADATNAVTVTVTTSLGTATGTFTYFDPPVITTPSLPNATVNADYGTVTITTAASNVTTWTATGLPSGLKFSSGVITGKPTAAGGYSVIITAANGGGSDTKTFELNVIGTGTGAPVIQSPATAFPDPTTPGEQVSFQVSASDSDGEKLSYSWDFGDSTTGSGFGALHTYAAPGTYTAIVTVSDGVVANDVTSSVTVIVNSISVKTANLKFVFTAAAGDAAAVTGTVNGLNGFNPTNGLVTITLGNLAPVSVTMSGKGAGTTVDKKTTFKLLGKMAHGVYSTSAVPFQLQIKNMAMFTSLSTYGFLNGDVPAPGRSVNLPLSITLNGGVYSLQMKTSYTAKNGKTGSAVIRR